MRTLSNPAPPRWADVITGRRVQIIRPTLIPGAPPEPLWVTARLRVSPMRDTSWWETVWGEQVEDPSLPDLDACGEPLRVDAYREPVLCTDLVAPGDDRCAIHGGRGR